jgi:hypothetical protein
MLTISSHKEMQIKTTLRFQKHYQQQVLARIWGERNPLTLLMGMQASATTLEKNLEAT